MTESHTFPLPIGVASTPVADTLPIPSATPAPSLITPDSNAYDAARAAWNLHADQRPACVCIARRVEDIQAAVAYARRNGLTVVAQSTGHLAQALPPHWCQRALARGHAVLAPDRLDEGIARHGRAAVQHEEREQQPSLPSTQQPLSRVRRQLYAQAAAEMYASRNILHRA